MGEGRVVYENVKKRLVSVRVPPMAVYMRSRNAGNFVSFVENMVMLSKKLKSPHFDIFVDLMIRCIMDYLEDKKIPLNLNSVFNQKNNLETILENSFPGYVRSGLFHLVWGRLSGKKSFRRNSTRTSPSSYP